MIKARDVWKREAGVDEIVKRCAPFINQRPELLSLLYDIDMLPEQTVTHVGARRLAALCAVWTAGEKGELSPPTPSPEDRAEDRT